MINVLRKTLLAFVLALLIVSCGTDEVVQSSPTEETKNTPTVLPSSTVLPTAPSTSTPPVPPFPTTPAQATIAAFDSLCTGAKQILDSEISPDGKWIAAICYWENGKEESPFQLVSIDGSLEQKLYYRNFTKNDTWDRKDIIRPYRWSRDGKYLYLAAFSKLEGCCWTGGIYVLLIQLNLETGEQKELLNATDYAADLPISFTLSDDDRYLLFTPTTQQPYDFSILDLLSLEKRIVELDVQKPVDLSYAIMSPEDERIVLPLYKLADLGYVVDSIVLINLSTNQQKVLVSDLQPGEELFPIRWLDDEHVLLSDMVPGDWVGKPEAKYWSLDTNTGERERVEKP